MQIKQLLREYTDWHEGSWSARITHSGFESLDKKLRRYLDQVLYVLSTTIKRAPEEYNEKLINYLRLIEIVLHEKNCSDQQLKALIVSSRLEIQQVLDLPNLSDTQYAWLGENGLDRYDILKLVKDNNLSSVFNPFYDNLDSYKEALGLDDEQICNIIRLEKGFEKIEDLKDFCLKPTSQILNFKGSSNLRYLLIRSNWKDKLEYLSDHENLKRLKEFGFIGYNILKLFKRDWRKKMDYFEDESKMQWLKEAGYNGSNLYYIIMCPEWRKKLDYLNVLEELRFQKFKSAGFSPYDIGKLLYPKKWRREINYIENEKFLNRLKESGMTCSQIAQVWMYDDERQELIREIYRSW